MLQQQVDSLTIEARNIRKQIRDMPGSFEKYQLQKMVVLLEDTVQILQLMADSLFNEVYAIEKKKEEHVTRSPYIVLDTVINDIKVYHYNFSKDTVNNLPESLDLVESKYNNKLEKEVENASFAVLDSSPYSVTYPFSSDFQVPDGPFYRIQLAVFSNPIPFDYFDGLFPITSEIMDVGEGEKLTKYYVGRFRRLEETEMALEKVRRLGYRDAFIVSYYNRIRMSVNKVYQYEKQKQ